jgi:hypothetical protein
MDASVVQLQRHPHQGLLASPAPPVTTVSSTRLGLTNLDERMRLAVGCPVLWGTSGDRLVVRVPLAPASAAHSYRSAAIGSSAAAFRAG